MEANWPAIILLLIVTGVAVYVGRMLFKQWFNPLSLYSSLWGFCLITYELNLIQYFPVRRLAWIYIAVGWGSLYLGSMIVFLARPPLSRAVTSSFSVDQKRLRKAIMVLSFFGAIGVADQIRGVAGQFGNPLIAAFANSGEIYTERVSGVTSEVPYFGALLFVACSLAGVYTARVGKLTVAAITPLVLETVNNIFGMFRAGVVMAAFLFLVSFFYTPRSAKFSIKRWQQFAAVSLGIAILVGGFVFVSATRGLGVDFPGTTPAMERISEIIPVFPSIYSNFSATPVALSMYLTSPDEAKTGHWGQFALMPIFRFAVRLGLLRNEARFEEDYYTPVPTNTATYLKNLDSDFGFSGIVFFPLLLGAVMTALVLRTETNFRLLDLLVLSNAYLIVVFSFVVNFMAQGAWYISMVVSVVVAITLERGLKTNGTRAPSRTTPSNIRIEGLH